MNAQLHLTLKPFTAKGTGDKVRSPHNRLSRVNGFLTRSATYFTDERLRKAGSPQIWTE